MVGTKQKQEQKILLNSESSLQYQRYFYVSRSVLHNQYLVPHLMQAYEAAVIQLCDKQLSFSLSVYHLCIIYHHNESQGMNKSEIQLDICEFFKLYKKYPLIFDGFINRLVLRVNSNHISPLHTSTGIF